MAAKDKQMSFESWIAFALFWGVPAAVLVYSALRWVIA